MENQESQPTQPAPAPAPADSAPGKAGVYRYIGNGMWLPGVPNVDVTSELATELKLDTDAMVRSGLYAFEESKAGKK